MAIRVPLAKMPILSKLLFQIRDCDTGEVIRIDI